MESVREESQQEVSQEDQSNEGQPRQVAQERQQQQQHENDKSQMVETADSDKDSKNKASTGNQTSRDNSAEQPTEQITDPLLVPPTEPPINLSQQERISPAPSVLVITPHQSTFAQMESFLQNQIDKCMFYKNVFQQQSNTSLTSKFETFLTLTQKDIEVLRKTWIEGGRLPGFKFETIRVTCTPTNVDIKDKELQIVVKTSNLPVAANSTTYVVGEFEFPTTGRQESLGDSAHNWLKRIKIEPKKFICCAKQTANQVDMIRSVPVKPFYDMDSKMTEYNKPLRFFVDKGRSRTLKRKFKPVKLTFYEKTSFVRFDKKIGSVQVKLDAINDDASLIMRSSIMNGRKQTEAVADIRVRVREPLVDKALKTHEEKFLVLT